MIIMLKAQKVAVLFQEIFYNLLELEVAWDSNCFFHK